MVLSPIFSRTTTEGSLSTRICKWSSEASIGIAWTTNKLNHLRFDSTNLRVQQSRATSLLTAAFGQQFQHHSVTAGCGTELIAIGVTRKRYAVEASTSQCFVLVFTMGSDKGTPEASPKRRRFHAVFRFLPVMRMYSYHRTRNCTLIYDTSGTHQLNFLGEPSWMCLRMHLYTRRQLIIIWL